MSTPDGPGTDEDSGDNGDDVDDVDDVDEGQRTGRAIEVARRAADDPQRPPAHTLRSESHRARRRAESHPDE